jgi:hypothetical protein
MTEDRMMVAQAVMDGLIPEYHLTQKEINELFEIVCDAATEKLMAEAEARGCSVFDGFEEDLLH